MDRVGGLGPAGEDVADGRLGVGIDVQVVGQVALRVEVDRQHLEPELAEDVAQGPDRRRLAGAALLGEDCDGRGHGRRTLARPTGVDVRSPPLRRGPRSPRSTVGVSGRSTRWPARPRTARWSPWPARGGSAGRGARRRSRRRRSATLHSTRSPFTNTPFRLRSSSTRTPSAWRTMSAWRRETVGSSKRTSAARLRPIRVHSRVSGVTLSSSPSRKARYSPGSSIRPRASPTQVPEAASAAAAEGGETARRGSPNSEARTKRSPPQPGHVGRRSSAASVTTYSQSRQRNEPVPASVPEVIASIDSPSKETGGHHLTA